MQLFEKVAFLTPKEKNKERGDTSPVETQLLIQTNSA